MIDRQRRATDWRIKESQFPVIKTIDSFDFKAQPSINEPLARELLRGEYIPKKENLLLVRNPGKGKAHLACAWGFAAGGDDFDLDDIFPINLLAELAPARHNPGANTVFCDGHVEYGKLSVWLEKSDLRRERWNNDHQSHPETWSNSP